MKAGRLVKTMSGRRQSAAALATIAADLSSIARIDLRRSRGM